ncbi:MAG: hypothetical protein F6K63_29935 [Moorea sp. SIO1G6]|uniref:hypothetical protein n=1 Tax=Moorena sp. SIO1G6 TaxID=2607840 RepID=UPI0013BFAC39|nr:hypothetical protein [Moorena sp. SIO1G6]NET68391.1 hypothetical protein [Moorena sp. SIO1G6]
MEDFDNPLPDVITSETVPFSTSFGLRFRDIRVALKRDGTYRIIGRQAVNLQNVYGAQILSNEELNAFSEPPYPYPTTLIKVVLQKEDGYKIVDYLMEDGTLTIV